LSVVYCGAVSRLAALAVTLRTFSGQHLRHPAIGHAEAVEVRVTGAGRLPVHADGEIVGSLPVTFRCVRDALEVMVPS
jgi:diacylglycerol kinase family enzyme